MNDEAESSSEQYAITPPKRRDSRMTTIQNEEDIKRYIEDCVERCVMSKRDRLADSLIDRIEAIVAERFQQEVRTLEQRWLHNPYMDMFLREHIASPTTSSGSNSSSSSSSSSSTGRIAANASVEYTELVRQIAYDFRRYFFLEWQRDLRDSRPQLDHTQRTVLREMIDMRLDEMSRYVDGELSDAMQSDASLGRRIDTLEQQTATLLQNQRQQQQQNLQTSLPASPKEEANFEDNVLKDTASEEEEEQDWKIVFEPIVDNEFVVPPQPPPPPRLAPPSSPSRKIAYLRRRPARSQLATIVAVIDDDDEDEDEEE